MFAGETKCLSFSDCRGVAERTGELAGALHEPGVHLDQLNSREKPTAVAAECELLAILHIGKLEVAA